MYVASIFFCFFLANQYSNPMLSTFRSTHHMVVMVLISDHNTSTTGTISQISPTPRAFHIRRDHITHQSSDQRIEKLSTTFFVQPLVELIERNSYFPPTLTISDKMSPSMSTCNKIRRIVRIRQMLQRWQNKAHLKASPPAPSDVPAGHVAVCVGSSCRRYIVRATYLNHPIFKKLLVQAEEEYGFANHPGPLAIPCDESFFEEVLRVLSLSESGRSGRFSSLEDIQKPCHVDILNKLEVLDESWPLLHGMAGKNGKSVCQVLV